MYNNVQFRLNCVKEPSYAYTILHYYCKTPRRHLTGQKNTSDSKDDNTDRMPELPDRKYLEDIDFVAQEFDLILRRPPDIPSKCTENVEISR